VANGINDSGQIVGYDYVGNQAQGFLYSGGNFTTIAVPGAADTLALGINDSDQIVGIYSTVNGGDYQGFIYSNGTYTEFGVPGAYQTMVAGINNHGDLVGTYNSSSAGTSGFLAAAVPEPSTVTLATISGFVLAGWTSWHRRLVRRRIRS